MNDIVTRHLLIRGRVQGVWYRESMRQEADRLDIKGWVRNRSDGSVEAIVQGTAGAVEQIVTWCRRGPEHASVARIDIDERIPDLAGTTQLNARFDAFVKLPTA
jgi:acylphosphatase